MSTDKENAENGAMEVEDCSDETTDTKPTSDVGEPEESSLKNKEKDGKKKGKGKEMKKEAKNDTKKEKKIGKVKEKKEESDVDEEEDEDEELDEEKSGDGKVPLLDQPLELSGTRERKKVTRFSEEYKVERKDNTPVEIPEGKGSALGSIAYIDSIIQRSSVETLKSVHKILFNRAGKASFLKKNIRKFNGFEFEEQSDAYEKKKQMLTKVDLKTLKQVCNVMDLKPSQKREELIERLMNFLMKPEDSGKPMIKARPKRAARSNNKSYSGSDGDGDGDADDGDIDEEEEKERKPPRRGKQKRANLKEVSSDEEKSDNERGEEEDVDDVKADVKKDLKDKDADSENETKENETDEDGDAEDDEDNDGDGSSDEDKSKGKKGARSGKNKKQPPKKANVKKPVPKKSDKKPPPKKRAKSDDESSEDLPLSKKSKSPPTDDEIKSYVKEILEGANLEKTTMKIVCKQVYEHYPDFDLEHKKDFIKTTVKSLISTT